MKKLYLFILFIIAVTFAQAQTYCVPTGGGSSTNYYLDNITTTLGSSNLNYTANSYLAYVDNSAVTFSGSPGTTINVNLDTAGTSTHYYYAWIDWNNDGDFLDAGETILATTSYAQNASTVINIPGTQAQGNYRVRFSSSWIGTNTSCGPAAYGNYVDFTLIIGPPPTCAAPTNVTIAGALATSATVSWTASITPPASGYDVYYNTTNVPPTGATVPNLTGIIGTTTPINGLTASTDYYVWVRANCSTSDQSFWAAAPSFTTACSTFASPFTESFTNGVLPNCWVNQNPTTTSTSTNAKWKFSGAPGYGVTNNGRPVGTYAWVDASSPYPGEHTVELISPPINLTGLTVPFVKFDWYKNHLTSATGTLPPYDNNALKVHVNDGTGWVQIFNSDTNAALWRTEGIALAASYANATIQLRFTVDKDVTGNGYFYDDVLLDEVKVVEAPTCIVPSLIMITNLSYNSTGISWTAPPTAPGLGYEIYYSTNSTPPTATTVPNITGVTTTTTTITGLLPSTTYYVWVRSKCTATDSSDWAGGLSFTTTTMCPTVTAPANGVLGISTTPTITWNALAGLTGYRITVGTTPGGTNVLNNVDLGNVTSYTFPTALLNSTQYFYKINGYDATTTSTGCAERNFSTACATFTAPFTEAFSTGTLPNCWINQNPTSTSTSTNVKWKFSGAPGYGATPNGSAVGTYAWVDASTPNTGEHTVELISPQINLAALTVPFVKFDWYKNHLTSATGTLPTYDNNALKVHVNDGTGWVQIFNDDSNASTWRTEGIALAANYIGATIQLRFTVDKDVAGNGYFYDDLLLDNVQVIEAPACLEVSALSVTNLAPTTATISWTAPATVPANGYQYYITTTNTPPTAGTVPTGVSTTTSVNLTGLTLNTQYYFWVRSVCSTTSFSLWTQGPDFTTLQIPATIPYIQPFTGPNDFVFVNGTQNNKWAYGSATGNPANSIYISNDNGVTNAYSGSQSIVQAYRDIIIPTGATNATFTFDWKAQGESSFDYFRVWLVPVTYNPTAGSQITVGGGRIQVLGNTNQQNTWQTYFNPTLNISTFAGQTMRLVYEWRNDGSVFNDPPVAIDNINLVIPTCQVPTNLTFNNVTSNSATINWNAANPAPVNGYQYYYSTSNVPPVFGTVPSGATPGLTANLTGLLPNTTYYFWVRSKCAGTDASLWMSGGSFTTGQIPATFPYINPFTDPIDFTFTSGTQVNKWAYGGATGNTGNSIYISNDDGLTNSYTITSTSIVHAYRDISLAGITGNIELSFDWKSLGQNNSDYMSVWAVPVDYMPTAGIAIPNGGGRIKIGGNFQAQTIWTPYQNLNFNVTSFAQGTMRLVFEWRNNNFTGSQPPAAVDNVKLVRCNNAAPVVTVSNILSTSAEVSWPQDPNGASYQVRYREIGSGPWNNIAVPAVLTTTNTYVINNLLPVTMYEVEVAAICNNITGAFTHDEFETRCDPTPPSNLTVTNVTSNSADVSWNPIATATYILQYREVSATVWTQVALPLNTTNYQITGLIPFTTYEVQISSVCSGSNNPFGPSKLFTTEPICEMAPIGLLVNNLTINSAQIDWNAFPNATYVLMYREVGFNNWVTVNLTTNTYLITGLTEETQYEVKVANVCGGVLQVFTVPYVFTTPTIIYCDMSSVNSNAEHISNVTVVPNVLANTVGAIAFPMTNDSGSSNYTSYIDDHLVEVQLIQGSTDNKISIAKKWTGTTQDEAVTVWIDFNRDGIFSNNERILTSGPNKTTPVTATFNVPSNAYVSLVNNRFVVMRVAMSRDGAPVMCGQFQDGEVEDYKVRISKPRSGNQIPIDSAIMVYPNPVKNILNVTKVKDGAKYNIYNAIGQLVMKGTIIGNKIDVSRLINGVFVIDVDSPEASGQVKFIKE